MAVDPRTYLVENCTTKQASVGNDRVGFFDSLGKVGDLEFLNDVGLGKVGKGLRILDKISNSVRVGDGATPSFIGAAVDRGANWVLDQVGFAPGVIDLASKFDPNNANRAYGEAKRIFEQVKSGNFKFENIPGLFSDIQGLERLTRGIYTADGPARKEFLACDASPYAMDLITAKSPKYKFLFVLDVLFHEEYTPMSQLEWAFLIKTSTRPRIEYDYEDVNLYNFHTKVIQNATFAPMSLVLHDDNSNNMNLFYNAYTRAMSPVLNLRNPDTLESETMKFDTRSVDPQTVLGTPSHHYASSIGPINNPAADGIEHKNIIKEIKLYHVFNNGLSMSVYVFLNPKITSLDPDDLDMANGTEGNQMTLEFEYDSMHLFPHLPMEPQGASQIAGESFNTADLTSGGTYQLRFVGNPSSAVAGNFSAVAVTGAESGTGGFGGVLGGVLGKLGNLGSAIGGGIAKTTSFIADSAFRNVGNILTGKDTLTGAARDFGSDVVLGVGGTFAQVSDAATQVGTSVKSMFNSEPKEPKPEGSA